ncbi:MAG TPA: TIGR02281 family clan AA aspartic protease [Geminicoccaceae bacterium]|nr:TIGR02281 family clan AA aspartic protease [Geminicoccaceae bacterium]
MIAMLTLALRYLLVVVVVGVGFAILQGGGSSERTTTARAAKPGISKSVSHHVAARPTFESDESDEDYGSDEGDEGEGWEYVVEAGAHGHFVIDAVVNGVPLTFLVDTGASETVLTLDDARQLGFLPQSLDFSQRFRTANGVVRGAPVRLRELRIGQFSLYNVDASVNEAPLAISLLGMSFLDRLNGYEVADGRLVLRW